MNVDKNLTLHNGDSSLLVLNVGKWYLNINVRNVLE
jgi:hypothetical protein